MAGFHRLVFCRALQFTDPASNTDGSSHKEAMKTTKKSLKRKSAEQDTCDMRAVLGFTPHWQEITVWRHATFVFVATIKAATIVKVASEKGIKNEVTEV